MLIGKHSVPGDIDRMIQRCCNDSRPIYIEIPADLVHNSFSSNLGVGVLPASHMKQNVMLHRPTLVESMAVNSIQTVWERAQSPIVLIGGAWRHRLSVEEVDALVTKLGCMAFYLLDGKSRITKTTLNVEACSGLSFLTPALRKLSGLRIYGLPSAVSGMICTL